MKRYIDAEKLLELLKEEFRCGYLDADEVESIPTEDVAPVIHAHWIYSGDEDEYDGYYRNCSFCGHQDYVYTRDNDRNDEEYCPCCGAKMDEDSENNG